LRPRIASRFNAVKTENLHPSDDVIITASNEQNYALCWIPAKYPVNIIRQKFHNQVRRNTLAKHEKRFIRTWNRQRVTVNTPPAVTTRRAVYPKSKPMLKSPWTKSARVLRQSVWHGISAFDVNPKLTGPTEIIFNYERRSAKRFGTAEKQRLMKQLRNARAAILKRINAIDAESMPVIDAVISRL
jgi:hypothetical protein